MPEQKSHSAEFGRNMSHDSILDPNSSVKLSMIPGEKKKLSRCQKPLLAFELLVIVLAIVLTVVILSSKKTPAVISKGNSI